MRWAVLVAFAVTVVGQGCGGVVDDDCVPAMQLVNYEAGTSPAGLERCGRAWNRTEAVVAERDTVALASCDVEQDDQCATDDQCTGQQCVATDECFCANACGRDDDCADDEACLASAAIAGDEPLSHFPRCVPATCRGPQDCGGSDCGVQLGLCGNVMGLSCRSAFDCVDRDDCAFGGYCAGNEGRSGWSCFYDEAAIACE